MIFKVDPHGFVIAQGTRWRAALGRGGVHIKDKEGDGITPIGLWKLGRVFYRADRLHKPDTVRPLTVITETLGWCDDPAHADYNTLVTLPHPARHETLWRDDHVYDIVIEVLFNAGPIVPGRGSAIFVHVARPDYAPTEGCVAMALEDVLSFLKSCDGDDAIDVTA